MSFLFPLDTLSTWPKPNYIDPPVYGNYLLPTEIVLLALSSTIFLLRMYTRGFMMKSFGLDDALIIPAHAFAILDSVSHMMSLQSGWGRHMWDVDWRFVNRFLYWDWLNGWTFGLTVMFTKLSILAFYLRFANKKKFRRIVYVTMAFLVSWSIGFIVPMIVQCVPVYGAWEFPLLFEHPKCISKAAYEGIYLSQGCLNLFSDLLLFFLPVETMWSLRRPKKERASLIALFGLGLLVCIFAGLRLRALYRFFSTDPSWFGYELWLWVSLEVHIGIITASLPAVKPLFVLFAKNLPFRKSKTFKSTQGSTPAEIKYVNESEEVIQIQVVDDEEKNIRATSSNSSNSDTSVGKVHVFNAFKNMTSKLGRSNSVGDVSKTKNGTVLGGEDYEEEFGGALVVYKSTQIEVTTESALEMDDLSRSMPTAIVFNHV